MAPLSAVASLLLAQSAGVVLLYAARVKFSLAGSVTLRSFHWRAASITLLETLIATDSYAVAACPPEFVGACHEPRPAASSVISISGALPFDRPATDSRTDDSGSWLAPATVRPSSSAIQFRSPSEVAESLSIPRPTYGPRLSVMSCMTTRT